MCWMRRKVQWTNKVYVEVNDDVKNERMRYMREVWTERQRNDRNRVNMIY